MVRIYRKSLLLAQIERAGDGTYQITAHRSGSQTNLIRRQFSRWVDTTRYLDGICSEDDN